MSKLGDFKTVAAPPLLTESFTFTEYERLGLEFESLEYPFRILQVHDGVVKGQYPEFPVPCRLVEIGGRVVDGPNSQPGNIVTKDVKLKLKKSTDWDEDLAPLLKERPLTLIVKPIDTPIEDDIASEGEVGEEDDEDAILQGAQELVGKGKELVGNKISGAFGAFSGLGAGLGDKLSNVTNVTDKLGAGLGDKLSNVTDKLDDKTGKTGSSWGTSVSQLGGQLGGGVAQIGGSAFGKLSNFWNVDADDSPEDQDDFLDERNNSAHPDGAIARLGSSSFGQKGGSGNSNPTDSSSNPTSVTVIAPPSVPGSIGPAAGFQPISFHTKSKGSNLSQDSLEPARGINPLTGKPLSKPTSSQQLPSTMMNAPGQALQFGDSVADTSGRTQPENPLFSTAGEPLNNAAREQLKPKESRTGDSLERTTTERTTTICADGPLGLEFEPFTLSRLVGNASIPRIIVKSASTTPDSAVRMLGIQAGDELLKVNNEPAIFNSPDALYEVLNTLRPIVCTWSRTSAVPRSSFSGSVSGRSGHQTPTSSPISEKGSGVLNYNKRSPPGSAGGGSNPSSSVEGPGSNVISKPTSVNDGSASATKSKSSVVSGGYDGSAKNPPGTPGKQQHDTASLSALKPATSTDPETNPVVVSGSIPNSSRAKTRRSESEERLLKRQNEKYIKTLVDANTSLQNELFELKLKHNQIVQEKSEKDTEMKKELDNQILQGGKENETLTERIVELEKMNLQWQKNYNRKEQELNRLQNWVNTHAYDAEKIKHMESELGEINTLNRNFEEAKNQVEAKEEEIKILEKNLEEQKKISGQVQNTLNRLQEEHNSEIDRIEKTLVMINKEKRKLTIRNEELESEIKQTRNSQLLDYTNSSLEKARTIEENKQLKEENISLNESMKKMRTERDHFSGIVNQCFQKMKKDSENMIYQIDRRTVSTALTQFAKVERKLSESFIDTITTVMGGEKARKFFEDNHLQQVIEDNSCQKDEILSRLADMLGFSSEEREALGLNRSHLFHAMRLDSETTPGIISPGTIMPRVSNNSTGSTSCTTTIVGNNLNQSNSKDNPGGDARSSLSLAFIDFLENETS